MERLTRSVDETSELLGVHPLTVRKAIARGDLAAVRVGKRVLIPLAAIEAFLSGKTGSADGTPLRP